MNTVSELVSLKPNQKVLDWMDAADENRLYFSVMTLGEIRQGVASLPQSKKRIHLESWLEVDLQSRFAGRILVIDGAVADRWGWITAQAQAKGMTLARGRWSNRRHSPPSQPHSGHPKRRRFYRGWIERH